MAAYEAVAGRELLRKFNTSCCLNGTAVAIMALRAFGMRVQPLVVDLAVFNQPWWALMTEHGWPTPEIANLWVERGAWCLATGTDDPTNDGPNEWPHHMVALAHGYIIDSSLGQASRPQKGILLPQVAAFHAPTPASYDAWWRGDVGAIYESSTGVVASYRTAHNVPFSHLPGFQPSAHNREMARDVITAMLKHLKES